MNNGLAVLEITALGASLVILDAVEKLAPVRLLQAELNDYYGYVVKILGPSAALRVAVAKAEEMAAAMHAKCVTTIIDAPDDEAFKLINTPLEYQPLIEQAVVFLPQPQPEFSQTKSEKAGNMTSDKVYAIGLIETQGFTAAIEAIDTACKAAAVEVIGKEKLGGGYVTMLIKGDVAAVKAAVEAGQAKTGGLGTLIAAHVIPRPSPAILSLLPSV